MAKDFILIAVTVLVGWLLFGAANPRGCIATIAVPAAAYGECGR